MRLLVGFTCAVMAIGCGDDGGVHHLPDAPPPPDADVDASTFGPVTLTVLEGTTPQAGIRVFFQNADSSLVSDTTTGSDGKASAMMMPGGFVTAIDPFPSLPQGVSSHDLRTFAGVKPGDQLKLITEPFVSPPSINVTITLPINASAVEYRVSTNCLFGFIIAGNGGSGGSPTATLQVSGCGPTSNLLVEAIGANAQPIAAIYKQSVALTDNGTLDLTNDTYTTVPDVTFSYTNVPPTNGVFVNTVRATSLGRIFELNDSALATGDTAGLTTKIPTISNATAVTASSVFSNNTFHLITEWGTPATTYALDFGGSKLPDFISGPTLDIGTHKVSWQLGSGAVQPDFAKARVFLGREVPIQNWHWTVATPSATEVVLPVLPGSSTFNPIEGDFASVDVSTGKVPGGYDAVRANILSQDSFQQIVLGASGKAAFNTYTPIGAIQAPPASTVPTGVLRGLRRR